MPTNTATTQVGTPLYVDHGHMTINVSSPLCDLNSKPYLLSSYISHL